jgi:hypothetical protein
VETRTPGSAGGPEKPTGSNPGQALRPDPTQVNTYQPGDRLRRLVQVRDYECTFPPCPRPAHESVFEHAIPYHKGGKTCA